MSSHQPIQGDRKMIGAMVLLAIFGAGMIFAGFIAKMEECPRIARLAWAVGAIHIAPLLVRMWMAAIMGVGE